jgi:hypothetical protein
MTGPSNAEFFRFLADDLLAFSLFRRSGDALISFKETIEFVLLPEATTEGPEDGVLFEGIARVSAADWREFVAGFAMTRVENRIDRHGGVTHLFHATKQLAAGVSFSLATRDEEPSELELLAGSAAPLREELRADEARYVWRAQSDAPGAAGSVEVHARRIACRGADKGMPAELLFREKLRQYRLRHGGARDAPLEASLPRSD